MDTGPMDSGFGATARSRENYTSGNGNTVDRASQENAVVKSAGTEMDSIASAIEELQGRLERANNVAKLNRLRSYCPTRPKICEQPFFGFASVNSELIKELNARHSMLRPLVERRIASIDQSYAATGSV
jgi:hypothetical protein